VIESLEIHDVDTDDLYDPMEITTADLADLLQVSTTTVSAWVRDGKIQFEREFSLGTGRPARVFDLEEVLNDLEEFRDNGTGRGGVYAIELAEQIRRLKREIERREAKDAPSESPLEQAVREVREEEITERDVLLNRISHLEMMVIEMAYCLRHEDPLPAEMAVDVLDIVLRNLSVED
jgi:hypothetical protein